jgi:segregation and condensation protein A
MYRVQLNQFEGPLDLLLFFIRRDELDVYDIPIARITDEYLAYVRVLEEVDLDGVADFIYMAAVLISIKAKMLLPRPEVDDEGEPIDPRAELVQRLLEYMRYKETADHLEERHERRGERFVRGAASAPREEHGLEPTYRASVFDLITALKRVMEKAPAEATVHPVRRYDYTIEDQTQYILQNLRDGRRPSFVSLVLDRPRPFVIATFLAILDMAQRHTLRILPGTTADDFRLVSGNQAEVHDSLQDAVDSARAEYEAEQAASRQPRPDRPALRTLIQGRPSDG